MLHAGFLAIVADNQFLIEASRRLQRYTAIRYFKKVLGITSPRIDSPVILPLSRPRRFHIGFTVFRLVDVTSGIRRIDFIVINKIIFKNLEDALCAYWNILNFCAHRDFIARRNIQRHPPVGGDDRWIWVDSDCPTC